MDVYEVVLFEVYLPSMEFSIVTTRWRSDLRAQVAAAAASPHATFTASGEAAVTWEQVTILGLSPGSVRVVLQVQFEAGTSAEPFVEWLRGSRQRFNSQTNVTEFQPHAVLSAAKTATDFSAYGVVMIEHVRHEVRRLARPPPPPPQGPLPHRLLLTERQAFAVFLLGFIPLVVVVTATLFYAVRQTELARLEKRDRYEEQLHQLWVGEQDTTERLQLLKNMRERHRAIQTRTELPSTKSFVRRMFDGNPDPTKKVAGFALLRTNQALGDLLQFVRRPVSWQEKFLFKLQQSVYPGMHGTFVESFYGSKLMLTVTHSGIVRGVYRGGEGKLFGKASYISNTLTGSYREGDLTAKCELVFHEKGRNFVGKWQDPTTGAWGEWSGKRVYSWQEYAMAWMRLGYSKRRFYTQREFEAALKLQAAFFRLVEVREKRLAEKKNAAMQAEHKRGIAAFAPQAQSFVMSAARSAMFAKPDAHLEGVEVPQKYLPPPLVLSTIEESIAKALAENELATLDRSKLMRRMRGAAQLLTSTGSALWGSTSRMGSASFRGASRRLSQLSSSASFSTHHASTDIDAAQVGQLAAPPSPGSIGETCVALASQELGSEVRRRPSMENARRGSMGSARVAPLSRSESGSSLASSGLGASISSAAADTAAFPMWLWFLSLKRRVTMAFEVYECFNLWGFVFIEQVPWPSTVPAMLRRWTVAEVQGELFGATFVAACGMYCVLLTCMLMDGLLVPDETEARFNAQFKKFLKSLTDARSIFSRFRWPMLPTLLYQMSVGYQRILLESLYVPSLVVLFSAVTCDYPKYEAAFLRADTSMKCWEGEHLNYSIVAIFLIIIIFVTNMYIVMWKKPFRISLYRFDPQFEGPLTAVKTVLVACGVFLRPIARGRFVIYPMIASLAPLLYLNCIFQPCRGRGSTINNLRTASFAVQLVGAIFAAVLIEGGEEATNLQGLCGVFYLLLVVPLFVHAWQLNNTNPLGHELPPKSLVKILEDMAEAATLRARLPTDSAQVLDRKHEEALRANLQTKSRLDFRMKLTACAGIVEMMKENPHLPAVKEGALYILQLCAADEVFTFRHMGSAVLAAIFGRDAPPRYRCMELVKGQPLTRPEAKLLAMHVCMNSALETVELNISIPIGDLRRDLCQELHYGGEYMDMTDAMVLRACLRPVHALEALQTITLTNPRARLNVCGLRTESIKDLHLTGQGIADFDLMVLCEWLKLNTTCERLDLSDNRIAPDGLRSLGFMLFTNQGLKSVNVRHNRALHMHSSMSQAELENLYLSYAVVTDGLERNHTLDVFEVGGVGVPSGPLRHMGASVNLSAAACAAAGLPTLQDLEAMLVGGAMVGARASRLTLAGAHLQERGVRSIAYALSVKGSQACRLTHLDLQNTKFGNTGMQALAAALRTNRFLTMLNLSACDLDELGAMHIASELRPILHAAVEPCLNELILANNSLGPIGVKRIAQSLCSTMHNPGNKTLLKLDLSNCGAREEGAAAIADMLENNETLEELIFDSNQMLESLDAGGIMKLTMAFGDCLAQNQHLRSLSMQNNGLITMAIQNLSKGLTQNNALVSLNLKDNHISMSMLVCAEMLTRLQHNISLREIILSGNPVESGVTSALHQRFLDLMHHGGQNEYDHHLVVATAHTDTLVNTERRKAENSHNHCGPIKVKFPGGMREEVAQHRVRSSAALLQAKQAAVLLESSHFEKTHGA